MNTLICNYTQDLKNPFLRAQSDSSYKQNIKKKQKNKEIIHYNIRISCYKDENKKFSKLNSYLDIGENLPFDYAKVRSKLVILIFIKIVSILSLLLVACLQKTNISAIPFISAAVWIKFAPLSADFKN